MKLKKMAKKECLLENFSKPITLSKTEIIIDQMKKYICKIKIDKSSATGFFCKIPLSNQNSLLPVLITNNHVIDNDIIKNKKENIVIEREKKCEIFDLNDRFIYTDNKSDITIIEIKNSDEINNYLELDDNIINNGTNKGYIKESIYVLQYPKGELSVSFGVVYDIEKEKGNNFYHLCSTDSGSSGSPILKVENNKLIGIHKIGNSEGNYNKGLFLNNAIKLFVKDYEKYKNEPGMHYMDCLFYNENNYNKKNISSQMEIDDDKSINNCFDSTFDITQKKGFVEFESPNSSRLNSIIQMLTSIKEIYSEINKYEYEIKKLNYASNLTILHKTIDEVFNNNKIKNPSLEELNRKLKCFYPNIDKKNISEYLLSILKFFDGELINLYYNNKNVNIKSLYISYVPNIINNYQEIKNHSLIYGLFIWLRKEDREINFKNNIFFDFQFIFEFDLEEVRVYFNNKNNKNKSNLNSPKTTLNTCFEWYSLKNETKIGKNNEFIRKKYTISRTSKYLLIILNVSKPFDLYYEKKLDISDFVDEDNEFKQYLLFGIIMKEKEKNEEKYCYIMNNKIDKLGEEWIKFKDKKVIPKNIKIIQDQSLNKELYEPFDAEILIYKAIKKK